MMIIEILSHTLLFSVGVYLMLNCCYLLFMALAGHKKVILARKEASYKRKICILIPAYKENVAVLDSAKDAINHPYSGGFDVFVIADGLEPATTKKLRQLGSGVLEVQFEKSTKGKALSAALDILPSNEYDIALVLDVDNIMGEGFLEEVNRAFDSGFRVIQAHRTAKNIDTAFAFLDACNEEINNQIYRKGPYAMGLSSALIGSGMAFDYAYFKKILSGIGETVGEDKELDFRICKDQVKICYLDQVHVYDEKIENAQVFTQQRTRWMASQLEFIKKYAWEGLVQLFKFRNLEFFNKVVQAFLVPRVLLIGILGMFFLVSLVIPFGPPVVFWAVLLGMQSAALFISLPGKLLKDKKLWEAMLRLPYALFCMCLALLRINKAKASFLPTPHKAKPISSHTKN